MTDMFDGHCCFRIFEMNQEEPFSTHKSNSTIVDRNGRKDGCMYV